MKTIKITEQGAAVSPLTAFESIKNVAPLLASSQVVAPWTYDGNEISLPYSVNATDGQTSNYAKGEWEFNSSITIHKVQPTYLWFDHADQSADVYINGTKVTTHWGGYCSFFVDITNAIQVGTNALKVVLNNQTRDVLAPDSADFNFNATLEVVRLVTSPVLPSVDYGYDGFHISSVVTDEEATLTIKTSIPTYADVVLRVQDENYSYTERKFGKGEIVFEVTIENPHLWNGKLDPHLYDVTLDLYYNGEQCHHLTRAYGLRYYTADNTGFKLNGQSYLLRGVCMHQDLLGKANALTAEDIDHDFDIIAELGCNFIRTAHYPHPKQFYDYCDRLGIVVQTEIPWVNKCWTSQPQDYWTHLRSQTEDMVRQHMNHPSIVFWGLGNEISNKSSFNGTLAGQQLTALREKVLSIDTSRVIGFVAMSNITNPLNNYHIDTVDWVGTNIYTGWYHDKTINNPTDTLEALQSKMGTKALAMSEYGCGGTQDCHSDNPSSTTNTGTGGARHDIEYMMWIHEGYLAAIRQMPELVFTSAWVLFDFAVESRNEGYKRCYNGTTTSTDDSLRRLNDKGLVMRDHTTKKDPFYLYKAEWSGEKFVHICQKSYTKTADRVIKCYSNDGTSFTLKVNGETIETVAAQDHIVLFTARTFASGDVVTVEGATTSDGFTF